MKTILVINGSASTRSSNERLIQRFREMMEGQSASEILGAGKHDRKYEVKVWPNLKTIPHFDPELSVGEAPPEIIRFRKEVAEADGILICTPEYVFSIPSGLKNVLEWCVATTIFTDKPVGIITASANGEKGHAELQMIMRTLGARLEDRAMLLIQGINGKIDSTGIITDEKTQKDFQRFVDSFKDFMR